MQKKSAINKFCMRVLFKLSKWKFQRSKRRQTAAKSGVVKP